LRAAPRPLFISLGALQAACAAARVFLHAEGDPRVAARFLPMSESKGAAPPRANYAPTL